MNRIDLLLATIRTKGIAKGEEIQAALGISQPVMSRLIRQAGPRVLRLGRARATRYGLPREVAGVGNQAPVYRVDEGGHPARVGTVSFLAGEPRQCWLEREASQGELFAGLPPFAWDMKPQGYIGRGFSTRFPDLGLPARITDWNDDHCLIALARRGEDCVGNLILGSESLDRFLAGSVKPFTRADFPALAKGTLVAQPGSSAGGEHPKFAVYANGRHQLVKFAGGDGAAADRWRDLLVSEHVALEVLRAAGVPAAKSAWFDLGGIRFLEVERFDRVGARGRRGVITLSAVNNYYLGYSYDSRSKAANRILEEPTLRLDPQGARRLRWLDAFGDLIGNTDRHFGNVSFYAEEAAGPALSLAPAYDMLPMAFAPRGGAVVEAHFAPHPPTALSLDVWEEAANQAREYWDRLCCTDGLSAGFRELAERCGEAVSALLSARR